MFPSMQQLKKIILAATFPAVAMVSIVSIFVGCATPQGPVAPRPDEYKKVAWFSEARRSDLAKNDRILRGASKSYEAVSFLLTEKQSEWSEIGKEMQQTFGMNPSQAYTYNPTNMTLYLVATEGNGATPEKPQLRPHRAFANDGEVQEFLKYLTARQTVFQQIEFLKQVKGQKEIQVATLKKSLQQNYGTNPDKQYYFDEESGNLYEVMPAGPSRAERQAAIRKQKQAIRDRQEIEKRKREEALAQEHKAKEEKRMAEAKAKEAAEAKEKLEKAVEKKAREEALAKEQKAKEEALAQERKVKEEKRMAEAKAKEAAEAKAKLEKAVEKKAYEDALRAKTVQLTQECKQEVVNAQSALDAAQLQLKRSLGEVERGKETYSWAKKNGKSKEQLKKLRETILKAERRVSGAKEAVKEAEKNLRNAKKALDRAERDAEEMIRK